MKFIVTKEYLEKIWGKRPRILIQDTNSNRNSPQLLSELPDEIEMEGELVKNKCNCNSPASGHSHIGSTGPTSTVMEKPKKIEEIEMHCKGIDCGICQNRVTINELIKAHNEINS